jgi:hypothetical protein
MHDSGPATDNDRPPEGCTTLSLDLLRQLRERGGTLTGLELIVHTDSGEWLKARVQKCDSDFKKARAHHTPGLDSCPQWVPFTHTGSTTAA